MNIIKLPDFINETKRYFHGEFSNFYEIIMFLEDRYEYLKKMVQKYPDRREDLKSIRYYLEFKYKGKPQKVYVSFGPWIKLPKNHVGEWNGSMVPGQDRIVLSPRYFHDNRNWLSKMSILYHELVHAIDPKSNPQGGKKSGELSLEILQKAKNMGVSLKGMLKKEGLEKFVDHLIANEIENEDLYAASPTEYDAWISELCFGVEQYLINLEDDEKEKVSASILDRMRSGDIEWTEEFVGGGGYMERFAKKNPKFIKKLFSALYSSIEGIRDLKRTQFEITSKIDMGPRERLKKEMSDSDWVNLLTQAESV
jgi:hypothetical protein